MRHEAQWWHMREDGRMECDVCPRSCCLHEGQRGLCFVRQRVQDRMVLTTYGRSSGFCVDPIEKKPLNHFYPGSKVLSFGTAGCNLSCRFCQNWDMSKSRDQDIVAQEASPADIALACEQLGAQSVAFTYNDPIIFAEYAIDTAEACHERGVQTVAVTAGYVQEATRGAFFDRMDAANVDLKGFTQDFYSRFCAGHLHHVLDTLVHIKHHTRCWLEITTLLIPQLNDSDAEIAALAQWVHRELGSDVPLHFSAFHPAFRLLDRPPTSLESLRRARHIALHEGLQYVYTGNVHDPEGGTTYCSNCRRPLIVRNWYEIEHYAVATSAAPEHAAMGFCPHCLHTPVGAPEGQMHPTVLAGRYAAHPEGFSAYGRQRQAVSFMKPAHPQGQDCLAGLQRRVDLQPQHRSGTHEELRHRAERLDKAEDKILSLHQAQARLP